jgi:hypothetical protein
MKQMWIAAAIFALVVAAFAFGMNSLKASWNNQDALLAQQGREAVGKVFIKPGAAEPDISYQFIANNQGYSSRPQLQSKQLVLLKNGMPLESGDEFVVVYVPSAPHVSQINFNRPTERQIAIYQKRVSAKHASLHPDEALPLVECKIKAAFDLAGVGGLADFYFQDFSPDENPDHNRNTFLRLVRDLPFQKKVEKECW